MHKTLHAIALSALLSIGPAAVANESVYVPEPLRSLDLDGRIRIDVLVDESNFGSGAMELAEITFYENSAVAAPEEGGAHSHDSTEIFYVLEGRLIHVVGGEKYVIEPGQLGVVRAGDSVRHGLETDDPVRALVIWVPGGEIERLIRAGFEPIDD